MADAAKQTTTTARPVAARWRFGVAWRSFLESYLFGFGDWRERDFEYQNGMRALLVGAIKIGIQSGSETDTWIWARTASPSGI